MWLRPGDDDHGSESSDALVWRGVQHSTPDPSFDPADRDGFPDGDDDDEYDDEPLRRRSTLRVMAVLGVIGFAFAATIVTGSTGTDDGDPTPATTIEVDDPDSVPDAELDDVGRPPGQVESADPVVADRPDVDLGLSYGGAGGGADIRDTPPMSPLSATPLLDPGLLPRLPDSVDTVEWSITIPSAELGLDRAAGSGDLDVDIAVVDDAIVVTAAGRSSIIEQPAEPGDVGGDAVVVLDPVNGSLVSDQLTEPVAAAIAAQTDRRTVSSIDIDPSLVMARGVLASGVADELTQRAIEQINTGEVSVLAAEEVAQGRAVAFIGDRLVGLRAAGGDGVTAAGGTPLIADWTRAGVLVDVAASDRGALLLVSDLRGRQQMTIDAATGETVAELSVLAWSDVYATAANGLVVRRPAAIGSVIEAVDLDGRPLWQLVGSPAWALGDDLIVTASLDASGLTVEARR